MDPMMIEHPPPIMVTLDMMMPMSQSVENIGLMEVGQLGPAIRLVGCDITMKYLTE